MSSCLWAALMPHPPVLIPQVGRGMENQVLITKGGLDLLGARLSQLPNRGRPDFILILSPHHFYHPGKLVLNSASSMLGNFGYFSAPEVKLRLYNSSAVAELESHLIRNNIPLEQINEPDISSDHGSLVPLYFLDKIWGGLPQVSLSCPIGLNLNQVLTLGEALAGFHPEGASWALVASGDLSHRLDLRAPGGYSPEGKEFDHDVSEACKNGDWKTLMDRWPAERLKEIGECGFRSVLCFLTVCGGNSELLSYEGPFGVGYACAFGLNTSLQRA